VVTQFYTYLDSGWYAAAYDLLSKHLEDYGTQEFYKSKDDFISYYQDQYDKVCLYTVEPAQDIDPAQPGVQSPQTLALTYGLDESHFRLVHVVMVTFGRAHEADLYPSGQMRDVLVGLAKEDDGRWRIISWR
jgi:hypothetical protein